MQREAVFSMICRRARRSASRLLRDIRASLRLRYALGLGLIGFLLLATVAFLNVGRQTSHQTRTSLVMPLDEAGSGYYVIDPPDAPARPIDRIRRPIGLLWLASVLFVVAAASGAWYLVNRHDRRQEETLQGYRRPRTSQTPSRIIAKRQALMNTLHDLFKESGRPRLTVRQLMTETVVKAGPATSLATLTNLLMSGPARHVLICDYSGRLLGIVTDRDLRHRRGKRAADVMTREPICIPPGALLGPAAALMVDNQISCLPVLEHGHVRGLLTSDQMILALQCVLQTRDPHLADPRDAAQVETKLLSDVQTLCVAARAADTVVVSTPPVVQPLPAPVASPISAPAELPS